MKIKLGDTVKVLRGKDKGKTGQVVKALPKELKVVIKGVNLVTKHIRPMSGRSGERVTFEKPFGVSKVAVINAKGNIDRIAYQGKGQDKTRIFRKTGDALPVVKKDPVAAAPAKLAKTEKPAKKAKKS